MRAVRPRIRNRGENVSTNVIIITCFQKKPSHHQENHQMQGGKLNHIADVSLKLEYEKPIQNYANWTERGTNKGRSFPQQVSGREIGLAFFLAGFSGRRATKFVPRFLCFPFLLLYFFVLSLCANLKSSTLQRACSASMTLKYTTASTLTVTESRDRICV